MPSIGRVTKLDDGTYAGQLSTLSIRANIALVPKEKTNDKQPDFIIMAGNIEVGAAWNKKSESSGNDYVSCSFAAPEFGNRTLYANLGQAAGSDDENEFAIIWNPSDE